MAPSDPEGSLRILLTVHHDLEADSGAAGSTLALADALRARGHDVEVCGLELLARRRGATVDAVNFPRAVARRVRGPLAAGTVDVVDSSTGDLAAVSARAVRESAAAVFTRSHGLEQLADRARRAAAAAGELELRRRYRLYHGGWRLREVARSLRCADGVLVLNDDEARVVAAELGVEPPRIWRTTPILRASLSPQPRAEARDLLILGEPSWRKGGDVAVMALQAVLRARNASATWAGLDDPAALAASIDDDLRHRVDVVGRFDPLALAGLLATHRVCIFASRFEGMPVTLIEALASGIAVVGSDIAGVRDLLARGAGLLVPAGHAEGFAASCLMLLDDPAARSRLGAAAVDVARTRATDVVVDDLVAAYRLVAATKRAAR